MLRDKYNYRHHNFRCIDMANSTNPSDLSPNEWYWVSVSTVCPLHACPQNLVFAHDAHRSFLCRPWGGILPSAPPRILPGLHFIQPGISARALPGRSLGFAADPGSSTESIPWCPRSINPSTPDCRYLVHAKSNASGSNVSSAQVVLHTTEYLRSWAKTMGFHPGGKCLLRSKWSPWGQYEGCAPGELYGSRLPG